MIIDKVSFTGADNKTDISRLVSLQESNPLIEWAVLYFPERDGYARNPTFAWREQFYNAKLNCAIHLCGSGINEFADGKTQLLNEIENFQRVQINLKPRWASDQLVASLIERCQQFPHIQFITQYNDDNMSYIPSWEKLENHAFLFDGSLGKGISPQDWPRPIDNKDCGYAGGLSPENISYHIDKISKAVGVCTQKIWIDMESGVRTNDTFDLQKVQAILEHLNKFQ